MRMSSLPDPVVMVLPPTKPITVLAPLPVVTTSPVPDRKMLSFPAPELIVVWSTVATMLSSPAVPVMVGAAGGAPPVIDTGNSVVADRPSWS